MHLDPAGLRVEDCYKLLIGLIVPRPIAWVSTIGPPTTDDPRGRPNLAPFSFFTGVGSNPLLLLFCPVNKPDGSEKDTLRNCKLASDVDPVTGLGGTGEFVVNVVDEPHARPMAACAEPLAYGESEFELAGVRPEPSVVVKPPRVADAPASFECVTHQVIRTNPGQPGGGNIVLGRVVHIHVRDDLADDHFRERFHTDPVKLRAIGRMGGMGYCTTSNASTGPGSGGRFEMPMGKAALTRMTP
jgi:flavin reductase (DIM6/NTAB) family NADH-FMN oxidoreductase RutF